jgi:hypothetical protein
MCNDSRSAIEFVSDLAGLPPGLKRYRIMNIPLAAILGMCLLSPWPHTIIVRLAPVMAEWQSTQPAEKHPSDSSQQGSLAQTPSDQQKAPDQTPAPIQLPCSANSQPGSTVKTDCKPAEPTGARTKKHHRNHKEVPSAGTPPDTEPAKKVVPNGGADEPNVHLSPGQNQEQAAHQIETTKQLLATSDANLKKILGRQLSANQQDTVKQIKSYMEQANAALKDKDAQDPQRAYNLAVKANLLSAELAGH